MLVVQLCPTCCNPMDCRLPGFSVCGILQARTLGVDCHFLLQTYLGICLSYKENLPFNFCTIKQILVNPKDKVYLLLRKENAKIHVT